VLFSILLFDTDESVAGTTHEEEAALMKRHFAVQAKLVAEGRLGPVVRLGPSHQAKTYRPRRKPVIIDGPFAETKEQLLGLYMVECPSMDDALEIARSLPVLNTSFEVRPVRRYIPGVGLAGVDEESPAVT
jgi:hypothetical protein